MQLIDFFDRGASLYPKNIAFEDDKNSLTYYESAEVTHHIATRLRATPGLEKGAHVAVFSPNDVFAFLCVLGAIRAEMVWLPINFFNSLDSNIEVLNRLDAEFLFYHSLFEEYVSRIRKEVPSIKGFICIDKAGEVGPYLHDWLDGNKEYFKSGLPDPDSVVIIPPSSGTTGNPKGVMHTHRNVEAFIANCHATVSFPVGSRHLVVAPMTHAAGLSALAHFPKGGTNYIMTTIDLQLILEMIHNKRITHLFLPPTVIYMLLAHPDVRKYDYSSLKVFASAAAPISSEKFKEAVNVFGTAMCEAYSQTECNALLTFKSSEHYLNSDGSFSDRALRSAGRPSVLVQMEIMNDEGRILDIGEPGEIVVRGTQVFKGYYNDLEQTEEVRAFGWHHTGDVGSKDEDGYITIIDRKKDMIISGGFNVFPSEVEKIIQSYPGVQQCAVIGVPDEKWGEAVKAVIKVEPGQQIDLDELMALCKTRLGGVKSPKTFDIWEELPTNLLGKVIKKEIRDRYWEETGRKI